MIDLPGKYLQGFDLACLETIESNEWENVFQLMDLLEDKSGASVVPISCNRLLIGFALLSDAKILSMVEYEAGESIADCIDILGYLFFLVFGKNDGEA